MAAGCQGCQSLAGQYLSFSMLMFLQVQSFKLLISEKLIDLTAGVPRQSASLRVHNDLAQCVLED